MGIVGGFTVDDLEDLPDDGYRYELLGGQLLVTPSPSGPHQIAVVNLWHALRQARPDGTAVLVAPFDVVFSQSTVLEPDVVVVRRAEAYKDQTRETPLLAVEVQSPSTRLTDLGSKRMAYEEAGVPSYWLVVPDGPSITVLELGSDGAYSEVVAQTGGLVSLERPFPVTVDLDGLTEP